ncbi:hypothetical protein BGZ63DRAFT_321213, partial [Mariannaea sp. PMI_226]
MKEPNDYTIGWICAIQAEYVAARAFLDEVHDGPSVVSPNDNNAYTLGKMGRHNVVIAVLPGGEYGISSAASVARDMMHSFCNIRVGLMVGIGGGAPSKKNDIRLGDVVVSTPRGGKSGVFQYDFGKTIQGQPFEPTGFLNQPPVVVRTAVTALSGQYESDGHELEEAVDGILRKKPKLRKSYSRPHPSSDRLYRSEVLHPVDDESSCAVVCGNDESKLVLRSERTESDDNLAIHYGIIASGNQLMKDASVRDRLAAEDGILCFEMEAAGLMNHFPCLVIRGICDYSDSHKNKEWQGYAAMAAAAYARELLRRMHPSRVEAEKSIRNILSASHKVAEKHLDVARDQLQVQKDLAKKMRTDEEQECHQLFRLTAASKDITYEWYKDRVEERIENTCQWFIKHEHFQRWLEQDSGPLLVTADPGCGKSVLAKYLIDHGLSRSATICYFFFKDQDQNTVRQALCALLHQLFSKKPSLITYAMPQFRNDGPGLANSTNSLWMILQNATQDSQAERTIIVLDALDECAESEFADLMRNVESQFRGDRKNHGKLKYLLLCRPYEQIVSKFRSLLDTFPYIRIPGEEESDTISKEVSHVITHRVNILSKKRDLSPQISTYIEKELQQIKHRTYLWVYLVFDYLEKMHFKKTLNGVRSIMATVPGSVNEAYSQILCKSKDDLTVRKALSIILAASRPLTLAEMNVAMNLDGESQAAHYLDLEDDEDFKIRLRSCCGLFISIHSGKIYFLHQTAREFLIDTASSTRVPTQLPWHHSITLRDAHALIARLCVQYLDLFNYLPKNDDNAVFLDYSAESWAAHFREANIMESDAITPVALRISDPSSKSYSVWFSIYWNAEKRGNKPMLTHLELASRFGHFALVKILLKHGADIEETLDKERRTPLSLAVYFDREAVVRLLLEHGADIETKNSNRQTPLLKATRTGHEAIVRLLLEHGANTEAKAHEGYTSLSRA